MRIRSRAIAPGTVVWLPYGFIVLSLLGEPGGSPVLSLQVPDGEAKAFAVLELRDGDRVPPMAIHLGTIAAPKLPRLHFPIPHDAMVRRNSARHYYLNEVVHVG